ncbi:uncharacterized protein LOC117107712 [Anneissia japonica]|uniref:uncharacterized protein LOC117107712 n=1 Tax=Anneissia japonica TaxID=1529436 RepID=UPI0014259150|nr:uncharacterized protein LOC117107712 [Anneissia japonica]
MESPITDVVERTQQNKKKVIQHYHLLRNICSRQLLTVPDTSILVEGPAKLKFKKIRGCKKEWLSEYLDEFMWREKYGTKEMLCSTTFYLMLHRYISCKPIPIVRDNYVVKSCILDSDRKALYVKMYI